MAGGGGNLFLLGDSVTLWPPIKFILILLFCDLISYSYDLFSACMYAK
jgi:hypothetical protein